MRPIFIEEPPETSAERLVPLSSLLPEHRFGRESFPQCLTHVPNSATPPEPRQSSPRNQARRSLGDAKRYRSTPRPLPPSAGTPPPARSPDTPPAPSSHRTPTSATGTPPPHPRSIPAPAAPFDAGTSYPTPKALHS